jgi:type IV secretory pathway VirB2 component (pilin)
MKNTIKNTVYSAVWALLIALNTANAGTGTTADLSFGLTNIDTKLKWSIKTADQIIQDWVVYVSSFLAIIAVIIIIWAGFQILTSLGDEEKTKKWKTIMTQAIIWLMVIFLAASIIKLVAEWLLAQ